MKAVEEFDLRVKRMPAYVHSPETVRAVAQVLLPFDWLQRRALFRQVQWLLSNPSGRVDKCIKYSSDKKMTKEITRVALNDLMQVINISILHPSDYDKALSLFLQLRTCCFLIDPEQIKSILNAEKGSPSVKEEILKLATKVSNGVTPRANSTPTIWKEDIMDTWIERAEKICSKRFT